MIYLRYDIISKKYLFYTEKTSYIKLNLKIDNYHKHKLYYLLTKQKQQILQLYPSRYLKKYNVKITYNYFQNKKYKLIFHITYYLNLEFNNLTNETLFLLKHS